MPQYLVTIHLPDNYDPSLEDKEMVRDINALNEELDAAGARVFAGGLEPASLANSRCVGSSSAHGMIARLRQRDSQ